MAWFLPGTTYSLAAGFWPNELLNVAFRALFVVPLLATHRCFHGRHDLPEVAAEHPR